MSELTIESLERAWDNVAEGGFLVFEPLPFEVRITKSRTGAKGLDFLLSADAEMEISSCEGFSAEIKGVDGQTVLSLVGTEANGTNVFETFAVDLLRLCARMRRVGSIAPDDRMEAVRQRIVAWQDFMRSKAIGLSEEKEVGLFGELTVLLDWLQAGGSPQNIETVWKGPIRQAHDFEFVKPFALEVKTSTRNTPFKAQIESLQQLDSSEFENLHLVALYIEETPEGDTLETLCGKIDEHFPTVLMREAFAARCVAAGLQTIHLQKPLRRFTLRNRLCLRADSMPRLTPQTVPGIARANYDVLLTNDAGSPAEGLDPVDYNALLAQTLQS